MVSHQPIPTHSNFLWMRLENRVRERTAELEQSNSTLRLLSLRLLRTQDEERRKIARELHDGVGQYLAGISMALESLRTDAKTFPASLADRLEGVDQAGRGRSGFDESVIHEALAMLKNGDTQGGAVLMPAFGRIPDDVAWTNWFGQLTPQGSTILTGTLVRHGDPGDTAHSENYFPAFPISTIDPNIVSRSGAIGNAPKGPDNYLALEYYKQLVPNAEVTLPGSTCATCDPTMISPANTWTPQDLALLVEKLGGAIVATHSQSGIMGHHMARILKERGHLDLLKGLITIEGSCSLSNSGLKAEDFDNIPYLSLKGDYTPTSEVCQNTVDAINTRRTAGQGIAKAEYIKLGELGNPIFKGTTHMMMLGTNNLEVADVILNWVDANIPPRNKNGKNKDLLSSVSTKRVASK